MGLDVFFRRDCANYLRAAAMAAEGALAVALEGLTDIERAAALTAYRRGYMAALVTVGLSFGLEPATGATVHQVSKGTATAIPAWVETPREL